MNRRFGGTSAHTRSTQRHIPEDDILHSHRCENLKSYHSLPHCPLSNINIILSLMIRLAGHIARMREISCAYKIVFEYHMEEFYSEEQALASRITLYRYYRIGTWSGFTRRGIGLTDRLLWNTVIDSRELFLGQLSNYPLSKLVLHHGICLCWVFSWNRLKGVMTTGGSKKISCATKWNVLNGKPVLKYILFGRLRLGSMLSPALVDSRLPLCTKQGPCSVKQTASTACTQHYVQNVFTRGNSAINTL
jgi:hypothetical protein